MWKLKITMYELSIFIDHLHLKFKLVVLKVKSFDVIVKVIFIKTILSIFEV